MLLSKMTNHRGMVKSFSSIFIPGESIKTPGVLKKSCSLNIEAMMLKTVLFYPRYVKPDSVIYPALIGHSFPSKQEIFCRKPLPKTCKNERKQQAKFPRVLLPSNDDSWMCSCIMSSWENGIPLNKLFFLYQYKILQYMPHSTIL